MLSRNIPPVTDEIITGHVPNTNQKQYRLSQRFWSTEKVAPTSHLKTPANRIATRTRFHAQNSKNIASHSTKFSHPGKSALRICAYIQKLPPFFFFFFHIMVFLKYVSTSHNSKVGTVTRLSTRPSRNRGSRHDVFCPPKRPNYFSDHTVSCPVGTGGSFIWCRAAGVQNWPLNYI